MRLVKLSLLALGVLLCVLPGRGQSAARSSDDLGASAASQPGKIVEYTLPPDKLEKAHALYLQVTRFQVIDTVYGFLMLLALLYFGTIANFRTFAEKKANHKWVQGLIVFPLFIVTTSLLTIPSEIYRQHVRRIYGLSIQGWASWWADWGKSLGISVVLGTLLLSLLYWMIRRSPKRWWLYGWLICIPVVIFMVFLAPLVIEPMFFKFTPLDQSNPELVTQIERVVHRGGLDIPRSRMFSMNASTKYTGDNAYVSGFGASKRVVVWDTTEKHMTAPQIMFVFGHEMGHYVLNHVVKGVGALLVMMLTLFYLAYLCSGWFLRRWGAKWQIREFADLASGPLFMLLLGIFAFVSNPLQNGVSRHMEHQADTFGLEAMHGLVPDSQIVAAQSFQKLGENWLEYPYIGDFVEWWSWDHPTTRKRMHYAQEYDPWKPGKEPEFIKGPPPTDQ